MPPLTTAMAEANAISRHLLASKRYRKLFRGVYLPADEPLNLSAWVEGARLVLPEDAVVTGLTALQLGGLDLGPTLPLQFAINRDTRSRREGIRSVRRNRLASISGTARNIDAIEEVCIAAGLLDAVTVIDRALHRKLIVARDLKELARSSCAATRRAVALARPGAESVRETQLRLCLVTAGLPAPDLQVEMHDEHGWIGRFDMVIEQYRLVIEYEGDQHRTDKQQWNRDISRFDRVSRLGYGVVRVTSQFFADPWTQVVRVHDELRLRDYRGPAPVRTPLWEELFGDHRRSSTL